MVSALSSHMASLGLPTLTTRCSHPQKPQCLHHWLWESAWCSPSCHGGLRVTSVSTTLPVSPTLRHCSVHCTNQWVHILRVDISVSHSPPRVPQGHPHSQFCVGLGGSHLPGSHGKSVHTPLLDLSHSGWCVCPRCSSSPPWSIWQLPVSRLQQWWAWPVSGLRRADVGWMSSQTVHTQDPWPFNGLELRKVECEEPPPF